MPNRNAARLRHTAHAVHHYPTRSDRHPLYLFGHYDLDGAAPETGYALDEAILGIREDPHLRQFAGRNHNLFHATIVAQDGRRFMFGVDPEQPQMEAPAEPTLYFWAV